MLLLKILKLLRINTTIEFITAEMSAQENTATDYKELIHPKKRTTSTFMAENSYPQMFGKEFEINLSILDLLFNEGPESMNYVKRVLA